MMIERRRANLQILSKKIKKCELLLCDQSITLAKLNKTVVRFTLLTTAAAADAPFIIAVKIYS